MSLSEEACSAADEIYAMLLDLRGPKDAALALLMAHVQMTMREGLDSDGVDLMLNEYSQIFKTAYFGQRPS